jgi:hypothetical protein
MKLYWIMAIATIVMQVIFLAIIIYMLRKQSQMYKKSPFFASWNRLQTELADTLHHPHIEAQEMDGLLEKLEVFTTAGLSTISKEDRARLIVLLNERVNDRDQTDSERTRAELLLFAMKRVEEEQAELRNAGGK